MLAPQRQAAILERVAATGGVRVADLVVEFAVSDLNAIKAEPKDAVVRCDNCGRILVRTAESGI